MSPLHYNYPSVVIYQISDRNLGFYILVNNYTLCIALGGEGTSILSSLGRRTGTADFLLVHTYIFRVIT